MTEKLFTFKQFIDKNTLIDRWPFTEGGLRSLYRRREINNLAHAFVKVGTRILIDEDKFYNKSD